ncbi:MAG: hypothetical protein WBA54_05910 [Acidaminobacteraceae bacterium]
MKKIDVKLKAYEDIIHLPHHVSSRRAQMTLASRAAQFAPFAAVVGHQAATKEASRYTDQKKELGEVGKLVITDQLREIETTLPNKKDVEIVYFKADKLKTGGKYITQVGRIKKLDLYIREIHMIDGTSIAIDEIYSIVTNPSKSD